MDETLRDLFEHVITAHSQTPRHYGPLPEATHVGASYNPLCGDQYRVFLVVEAGLIQKAQFHGYGCAVSMASCSLMIEQLPGKSLAQAQTLLADFTILLRGAPADPLAALETWGDAAVFQHVAPNLHRRTCALMGWQALADALTGAT